MTPFHREAGEASIGYGTPIREKKIKCHKSAALWDGYGIAATSPQVLSETYTIPVHICMIHAECEDITNAQ